MSLERNLADFGQLMGINGLAFNEQGVIGLDFEQSGSLTLERAAPIGDGLGDSLIMALSRPLDGNRELRLQLAARAGLNTDNLALNIQPGADAAGNLVLFARVPEAKVEPVMLEQLLDRLIETHNAIAEERTA